MLRRLLPLVALALPATAHAYTTPGYHPDPPKVRITSRPEVKPRANVLLDAAGTRFYDVVVDAAGTAHIVWAHAVSTHTASAGGFDSETVMYCRLPRAATACAVKTQVVTLPGATSEIHGLQVRAIGDDVAVVVSEGEQAPKNQFDGTGKNVTSLIVSADGGSRFSPAKSLGDVVAIGAAVIGTPATPGLAVLGDPEDDNDATGLVQTYAGLQGSRRQVPFGFGFAGIHQMAITADGGAPLVGWLGKSGSIGLARWDGQGDPGVAASWRSATIAHPVDGNGPKTVSDASIAIAGHWLARAAFVDAKLNSSGFNVGGFHTLKVARVDGLAIATPETLQPRSGPFSDGSGSAPHLAVDTAGTPRVGTGVEGDRERDHYALWPGGPTGFGRPQIIIDGEHTNQKALGGDVRDVTFDANPDGGGVAVFQGEPSSGPGGNGVNLFVTPFGTRSPTGKPGLGQIPGGGSNDPDVTIDCDTIVLGSVIIRSEDGCLASGKPKGRSATIAAARKLYVAEGPVTLDGVTADPGSGRFVIDPKRRTLDASGKVTVSSAGLRLYRGALHLRLPKRSSGLIARFPAATASVGGLKTRGPRVVRANGKVTVAVGVSTPEGVGTAHVTLPALVLDATGLELPDGDVESGRLTFAAGIWSGTITIANAPHRATITNGKIEVSP